MAQVVSLISSLFYLFTSSPAGALVGLLYLDRAPKLHVRRISSRTSDRCMRADNIYSIPSASVLFMCLMLQAPGVYISSAPGRIHCN